jgi:hypothetical protein
MAFAVWGQFWPHKWAHNIRKGVSFFLRTNPLFLMSLPMPIGLVHPTVNRWRLVMKRLLTLGAASIAVLLLIVMPVASQAPQAEKTFSGMLTKVDAAKKVITVKGTGYEPEMTFEGLAGKSGATLKVTYREEGANRIATKIEVSEAKK